MPGYLGKLMGKPQNYQMEKTQEVNTVKDRYVMCPSMMYNMVIIALLMYIIFKK